MSAEVDTWVCDHNGDGVLVWSAPPGASLAAELRTVTRQGAASAGGTLNERTGMRELVRLGLHRAHDPTAYVVPRMGTHRRCNGNTAPQRRPQGSVRERYPFGG